MGSKDCQEVRYMTVKIIAIALLSVFLSCFSYGSENLYTWIDEQGVLNITDTYPPAGAKIIDTSPSYRQQAEEIEKARFLLEQKRLLELNQKRIEAQLVQAERIKTDAQKKTDELMQKAIYENEKKGTRRTMRWARRKARMYYHEALQASQQAEKAQSQIDMLKEKLDINEEGSS